ncbi:MAG: Asp-tRNA(Asn)/Glu-tRNA(Gln) amidotransferase subunit GatA [Candidatus Auribacterota bacterium]|nr:Asp-tRNA(Asn)/Glu-tRNA(Gln) amidotransferase subunit GatA [Candidatus Auribacterota bacterium]
MTAHEIAGLVLKREISAVEATEACLSRVDSVDPVVRAFIRVDREGALAMAGGIDRRIAAGEDPGILAGVPIALKDILSVNGKEITCGSKILRGYISPYDATVVRKLREAGAVILGQTNMDEFAMGSSTENSAYWPTRNPWDTERVPGGSSGGSAAAVAADETIVSLGTDTGGSIRQPAALCGVAGMKPTYGRVSRFGLIAYASSLDQIGPFGKDVEDIALVLEAISGPDRLDSTSAPVEVPRYRDSLIDNIAGMKLGVPRECFIEGMEEGVERAFRSGLDIFRSLGAEIVEVELPRSPYSVSCYYILSTAEASSNLARYDGVQYGYRNREGKSLLDMYESTRKLGFGEEVKRRILLGSYVLSAGYYDAYYVKALKVRRLIKDDFDRAFAACDSVVMPTSPSVAFKIGERMADPLRMYLSDIFTIGVNLAGLPAISINCGFDPQNLPVGLQVIAPPFSEEKILRIAYTFERNSDFQRRPEGINPESK